LQRDVRKKYNSFRQNIQKRGVVFDPIERFTNHSNQQQIILVGYAHLGVDEVSQTIEALVQATNMKHAFVES
jgi:hypothetical protein